MLAPPKRRWRCHRRAGVPLGRKRHEPAGMRRVQLAASVHRGTGASQHLAKGRSSGRARKQRECLLAQRLAAGLFRPLCKELRRAAGRVPVPRVRRSPARNQCHRLPAAVVVARSVVAVPRRCTRHWCRPSRQAHGRREIGPMVAHRLCQAARERSHALCGQRRRRRGPPSRAGRGCAEHRRPQPETGPPRRRSPRLPCHLVQGRSKHLRPCPQPALQKQLQVGTR